MNNAEMNKTRCLIKKIEDLHHDKRTESDNQSWQTFGVGTLVGEVCALADILDNTSPDYTLADVRSSLNRLLKSAEPKYAHAIEEEVDLNYWRGYIKAINNVIDMIEEERDEQGREDH